MNMMELKQRAAGARPTAQSKAAQLPPASSQATGGFRSFGEQLSAIRRCPYHRSGGAIQPIGQHDPDPRLQALQWRAAAAGAGESVPSSGGFLVASEFTRAIVERMYSVGAIYSRCLEVPISTNSLKFPQFSESSRATGSRLGGVQVYLEDEAQALVGSHR